MSAKTECPDVMWILSFVCCGYDYLTPLTFDTWEEADRTRECFTSGPGARPYGRPDLWGHERAAIITSVGLGNEQQETQR